MADLTWPADLKPRGVSFYLQPHVGGTESPISRVRKVYGLSAPRWIARYRFRGGYAGAPSRGDAAGFGPRLDSLIADLEGGLTRVRLWDFRRPRPRNFTATAAPLTFLAATKGAQFVVIAGFTAGAATLGAGEYIGGDGRPHIVSLKHTLAAGGIVAGAGTILADANGRATIGINPPLSADIAAGTPVVWPVTGRFQLVSEDAGDNDVEPGKAVEYTLDFVEDLLPA